VIYLPYLPQGKELKMTEEQIQAIEKLHDENPDGAKDLDEFRARFGPAIFSDHVGGQWCGMYIGIEADGYTHA